MLQSALRLGLNSSPVSLNNAQVSLKLSMIVMNVACFGDFLSSWPIPGYLSDFIWAGIVSFVSGLY